MKNLMLIFSIALLLVACNENTSITADKYNDKIVAEIEKNLTLVDSLDTYIYYKYDQEKCNELINKIVEQSTKSIKNLDDLGNYHGDATLVNSGITILENIRELADNQYKQLVYLNNKKPFTDADYKKMLDIYDEIQKKIYDKYQDFLNVQETFAENNNLELL